MKLKHLLTTALLLSSTTLSAIAADIVYDGGTSEPLTTPTNGASLYVGKDNNGNILTVGNGGSISVTNAYIGEYSHNNELLISGTNASVQISEELVIGAHGNNNSLTTEDGGWISIGSAFSTNSAGISVGNTDATAQLTAQNGSTIETEVLYVGVESNETGSIELTGSGSKMTVSDSAYIGLEGSDNTFTVGSDTTLVVSNLLQVGSATSTNNTLNIERNGEAIMVGSVKIENPGKNSVHIKRDGKLTYTGNANIDAAGAAGFDFDSGANLEIGGALTYEKVDDGLTVILNNSLNTALTSKWDTVSNTLLVGDTVGNNKLVLQDGAKASTTSDACIGQNSNSNSIEATGTNSALNVSGDLFVGKTGSYNKLNLSDGGKASIGGDLRIGRLASADSNEVNVSGTNVNLAVTGTIIVGEDGDKNSLTLSDDAEASALNLIIGKSGGSNELKIESGAELILTGNAYLGTNSANNTIMVTGTNSFLDIGGDLFLGNLSETNSNNGNTLSVFETARASIASDMFVHNGATVQIEAGSQITVGGDYWQDETSELAISLSTNSIGMTNLAVVGEAHFATNTTITVFNDGTNTNEFEQIAVSSSGLFFGTNTATTALLNDTNSINFVNDLLSIIGMVTNENIVLTIERLSIASQSELEGTYLEPLADEIDDMALLGSTNANTMRNILGIELDTDAERNAAMNNYYGEKASSSRAHNMINMGMQSVAEQLTMRSDNTRTRRIADSAVAPNGAAGPHESKQVLKGWLAGYGTKGTQDAGDGFGGYDASAGGFLIGADFSVAENVLLGICGGRGTASIDQDNAADTDTKTTYGAVYASIGTHDWFADASFIYGNSDIDTTLGTTFDTTAEYDAMNVGFYLGGGKEIVGDYLIITPQASLLANYYTQDAYNETASDAVARSVESFDALYVQSSLGCSLSWYASTGNITFRPEIRAHWLHEFNAREEDLGYKLIGGSDAYNMILQAPEEDILKLGAGVAAKLGELLELRADLDTRRSANYSDTTLLGSVRYQF